MYNSSSTGDYLWCNAVIFLIITEQLSVSSVSIGFWISFVDAHILYISRGLMTDLSESRDVLDIINKESATIANNIYINTYAVVDRKSNKDLPLCDMSLR